MTTQTTHWEATKPYGGSEQRRLVRDSDSRVLVTIVHGDYSEAVWTVCIGSKATSFTTEQAAKKFSEQEAENVS